MKNYYNWCRVMNSGQFLNYQEKEKSRRDTHTATTARSIELLHHANEGPTVAD